MPIYEYRCASCGHQLEALQSISAAPLTECPSCGLAELKKLVSAVAFRLKGSGWYETDFKSQNRRNLADSAQEETSAEKKGKEDKKDQKDKKDRKEATSDTSAHSGSPSSTTPGKGAAPGTSPATAS
jgi:putative FmdB family regulatory protein